MALFLAAVVLQVTVPSVVLLSGPSSDPDEYLYRYGWQMFTSSEVDVRYLAVAGDGTTRRVSATRQVGSFWGHVHYGAATPQRLCAANAEAVAVVRRVMSRGGERRQEHRFACS